MLTSSDVDRCTEGEESDRVSFSGCKLRYSAMNTRRITFHRRIVGTSKAETLSYKCWVSHRRGIWNDTNFKSMPHTGEWVSDKVQYADPPLEEWNVVISD